MNKSFGWNKVFQSFMFSNYQIATFHSASYFNFT